MARYPVGGGNGDSLCRTRGRHCLNLPWRGPALIVALLHLFLQGPLLGPTALLLAWSTPGQAAESDVSTRNRLVTVEAPCDQPPAIQAPPGSGTVTRLHDNWCRFQVYTTDEIFAGSSHPPQPAEQPRDNTGPPPTAVNRPSLRGGVSGYAPASGTLSGGTGPAPANTANSETPPGAGSPPATNTHFGTASTNGPPAKQTHSGTASTNATPAKQSHSGVAGTSQPASPPRQTTLAVGTERICDLRTLAAYTFGGYFDSRPVARVRIVNATNPDTYLLLLSGMQPRLGGSTNVGDALISLFNVQGLDSYRLAMIDAIKDLPSGSTLILAGHSQGGMEAQNGVANLVERHGFKVPQVITFGSPASAWKHQGTDYLHLRERHDPVPALDRHYDLTSVRLFTSARKVSSNPWDPDGAHLVYDKTGSGLEHAPLPSIKGIKGSCLEVDLRTLVRKEAPDYFTRAFTRPANHTFAGATPRNPDIGFVNCFWVSLAQDRYWRTGIPYYAQCEPEPISPEERTAVLVRQFGGLYLDDGLGPTPRDAMQRHHEGRMQFTSRAELERALLRIGTRPDGHFVSTGGLVHVQEPGAKVGHVFNVRLKANGALEYADAQTPLDPRRLFGPATEVFYYRTF